MTIIIKGKLYNLINKESCQNLGINIDHANSHIIFCNP